MDNIKMKREIMQQAYEQIINNFDYIEVKIINVNKTAKFNLVSKENKKSFIVSMIEHFKNDEDYEKCAALNYKLNKI